MSGDIIHEGDVGSPDYSTDMARYLEVKSLVHSRNVIPSCSQELEMLESEIDNHAGEFNNKLLGFIDKYIDLAVPYIESSQNSGNTDRFNNKDYDLLDEMITLVKSTEDNAWCTDVVRSQDGKRNCFFGHLFDYYEKKGGEKLANRMWDKFENIWATTYMVYAVNDGDNPGYQQSTPKQRILAFLENLRNGIEDSTSDMTRQFCKWYSGGI